VHPLLFCLLSSSKSRNASNNCFNLSRLLAQNLLIASLASFVPMYASQVKQMLARRLRRQEKKMKKTLLFVILLGLISMIYADNPFISALTSSDEAKIQEYLVNQNFDVFEKTGSLTPFIAAITATINPKLKLEVIDYLTKKGVDIHEKWFAGYNALNFTNDDDVLVIQYLINNGLDKDEINEYGFTPLMTAIANNKPRIISILLLNGANPRLITSKGVDSIMFASQRNKYLDLFGNLNNYINEKYCDTKEMIYRDAKLNEYKLGDLCYFQGEVLYVGNDNGYDFLLINTDYDSEFDWYIGNTVKCSLEANAGYIKGDIIKVYGRYEGSYEYITIMRSLNSVPSFHGEFIELVKASN